MDNTKKNILETNKKEEVKEKPSQKIIKFTKRIPYKPIIVLIVLLLIAVLIPKKLPSLFEKSNYSKVEKICNLATIEAYYHNVAIKEVEATTIGKIFGNIGYKKYWLEYDAIIQYGIDAKKVKINKPNLLNEVKVYIPDAEILGEPKLIKEYIQDPITDTGFLTSVTSKDKTETVEKSINELKINAQMDTEHLNLAKERAKTFFEKYIINAGKEIGQNYKIIFIN